MDIANLKLEEIRELTKNLGFAPESRLMKVSDVGRLWERDDEMNIGKGKEEEEGHNKPYDLDVIEPHVEEVEPTVEEAEAKVHHVDPLHDGPLGEHDEVSWDL